MDEEAHAAVEEGGLNWDGFVCMVVKPNLDSQHGLIVSSSVHTIASPPFFHTLAKKVVWRMLVKKLWWKWSLTVDRSPGS